MHFLIALCLIATACADQLGYNYQPVPHSNAGLSFQPGSGLAANSAPTQSSFSAPATLGATHYAQDATLTNGPASSAPASAPIVEYEKEFYTFTGPEIPQDNSGLEQHLQTSLKKHLRVIFIKNPEDNGLQNAAVSIAQHANEQQTAIYVLHKQADVGQLAQRLNSVDTKHILKPEVHFVKYRTQEDATNAQKAIQAQYDQFGGSSHSHNGGVAPLLNFASQAAPLPGATAQSPKNVYLPSSVFRY